MRALILIGLLFFATVANVEPANADAVIWSFVETSCTGECTVGGQSTVGQTLAQLTLPNGINSSGTYLFESMFPPDPPIITTSETGDPFSFQWAQQFAGLKVVAPEPTPPLCGGLGITCGWAITHNSGIPPFPPPSGGRLFIFCHHRIIYIAKLF